MVFDCLSCREAERESGGVFRVRVRALCGVHWLDQVSFFLSLCLLNACAISLGNLKMWTGAED